MFSEKINELKNKVVKVELKKPMEVFFDFDKNYFTVGESIIKESISGIEKKIDETISSICGYVKGFCERTKALILIIPVNCGTNLRQAELCIPLEAIKNYTNKSY
jgi:hypothetical protein